MNKFEVIDFIENRPWQGPSFGLDRMEKLMNKLNNPQKKLKFVHVAGTNGKGSACLMMTSILMKAGYRVGTYISPHLIDYEERFSINNINISEKEFCFLVERVKSACESLDFVPRVFEILTAVSFLFFKRHKCDVVILEVGMGGRLDATNIIDESLVSILMNIGLEHTEILGDTLGKIAYEKAGIIKDNGEVVAYNNSNEVIDVFRDVAESKKAHLKIAEFNKIEIISEGIDRQIFNYKNLKNIKLSLLGGHQFKNAATVIEACKTLNRRGFRITGKDIKDGLKDVKWAARLSTLSNVPMFILDGAHNPQCSEALSDSLKSLLGLKKAIMLCGMLKDKDYSKAIDNMIPFAKEFICVTPNSNRALEATKLADYIKSKNQLATSVGSIEEGIKLSLEKANNKTMIIAFGSLYLAGEVLKVYDACHKDYLRKNMISKRNKLSKKKVESLSSKIVNNILKSEEYKKAKNILIYSPINNEVDLSLLTNDGNKVFAYPRCKGNTLTPLIPKDKNSFEIGPFNIFEPMKLKSKIMKDIDMIICPLICFDNKFNRLGYGKGFYDRFLKDKKCTIAGVAYSFQRVEEIITEKNDVKMDIIYTEECTQKIH